MSANIEQIEDQLFNILLQNYEKNTQHTLQQLTSFEAGKTIFEQGGNPRGIYFIKSGRVKIIKNNEGLNKTMYRIAKKGEFVGFLSLIQESPYWSTAQTLEPSEIWFIARPIFLKTLKEDINFANGFVQIVCQRLQYAEEYIEDLKTKDVRQRLATAILSLATPIDNKQSCSAMSFEMKRKDLALIVTTTPETLSRHLKDFQSKNFITLIGKKIELLDADSLIKISNLTD